MPSLLPGDVSAIGISETLGFGPPSASVCACCSGATMGAAPVGSAGTALEHSQSAVDGTFTARADLPRFFFAGSGCGCPVAIGTSSGVHALEATLTGTLELALSSVASSTVLRFSECERFFCFLHLRRFV